MKTLIKWAFRLFILMIVLLVGAILLMDTAFKALAERRIKEQTGLDVKIGKFEISFLNRKMVIENLVLYNNAEFGGSTMINMPELYLECDAEALQSRRLRFKVARFNLSELNIVNAAGGKNNFTELMNQMESHQKQAEKAGKKTVDSQLEFDGIDNLNLTLGKLRWTDLKNPSKSQEYDMKIKDELVTGIKTQEDIAKKMMPLLVRSGSSILNEYLSGGPTPPPAATPNRAPIRQ